MEIDQEYLSKILFPLEGEKLLSVSEFFDEIKSNGITVLNESKKIDNKFERHILYIASKRLIINPDGFSDLKSLGITIGLGGDIVLIGDKYLMANKQIINEGGSSQNTKGVRKVFISHASRDSDIVEELIDVLETIGLESEQIFCTSFEGYGIDLGENFLDKIRGELESESLVIFLLSRNFYQSPVCLCEMGATWVLSKEHIPVLIPPLDYSDVEGVIPLSQGMKINDPLKMNSLKAKIENLFNLSTPLNSSTWERKRDRILARINETLENQKADPQVEIPQAEEQINLTEEETNILKLLFDTNNDFSPEELAHRFSMAVGNVEYHLNKLLDYEFVHDHLNMVTGATYSINSKGRAYIVENNM